MRERRDAGSRFEVMVSEAPIAHLTRRYMFSASHRLHSPGLSEAENAATYGKCNNPFGHGHNYVLEVTAAGAVHPVTGMVLNLPDLDAAVQQEILARFDHQNLNTCAEFSGARVPTSENVCQTIYMLLCARWTRDPSLGGTRLEKVRLEETHSNSFEYGPR